MAADKDGPRATRSTSGRTETPGVISIHEVYRLDEALRRLGWSESALRSARRRGLKTLSSGKRRYLTGNEILRFLETDDASQDP